LKSGKVISGTGGSFHRNMQMDKFDPKIFDIICN